MYLGEGVRVGGVAWGGGEWELAALSCQQIGLGLSLFSCLVSRSIFSVFDVPGRRGAHVGGEG